MFSSVIELNKYIFTYFLMIMWLFRFSDEITSRERMKIKRAKKVSKILSYFKQNFGFHSPYLILIDGTFCAGCLTAKVNIKDQLPKWVAEDF